MIELAVVILSVSVVVVVVIVGVLIHEHHQERLVLMSLLRPDAPGFAVVDEEPVMGKLYRTETDEVLEQFDAEMGKRGLG